MLGKNSAISLLMLFLLGCATTTETDPDKVSASDLWFGKDRLDGYLAERRKELRSLQADSERLGQRLQATLSDLRAADRDFDSKSSRNSKQQASINNTNIQIDRRRTELNKTKLEIDSIRSNLAKLQKQLATKKIEDEQQLRRTLTRYEIEIEDLQGEVSILERAISGLISARAKAVLEST